MKQRPPVALLAALFLIAAVVAFRLTSGLTGAGAQWANFSPVAALVLCGAAFLPARLAVAVPLAAMLLTDLVLNLHYRAQGGDLGLAQLFLSPAVLLKYVAFAAIFAIGWRLRRPSARGRWGWKLLPAAALGSVLFYLLANTGAWLTDPAYSKSVAGWWQAQTVGLPPFPPSLLFLRNALVGDMLFTATFCACFAISSRRAPATSAAPLPAAR